MSSKMTASAKQKLAKASRLRKRLIATQNAVVLEISQNQEVKDIQNEKNALRDKITGLDERLAEIKNKAIEANKSNVAHIHQEIAALEAQAKAEIQNIPAHVQEFIEHITNGVNYSAGFQVIWYNTHFVIMRLAGRRCWSGIGRPWSYIKAETKMYDLRKFKQATKRRDSFGALEAERGCCVKSVEGRISSKTMKEWKEEADFKIA